MFQAVMNQVRLTMRLLRDPRVPIWMKAVPFLGLVYVLSPLDLIPDWIIGLGQLDDLGIILGSMRLFEMVAPADAVAEHRLFLGMDGGAQETVEMPRKKVKRSQ